MKNWYELDIGVDNALTVDVRDYCLSHPDDAQIFVSGVGGIWLLDKSVLFDSKWMDMVRDRAGLDVTGALVFYRTAGYQHPGAHIDIEPVETETDKQLLPVSAAYNWVLEPTDAEMVWYKPWWDPEDYEQCLDAVKSQARFEAVEITELQYNEIALDKLKEVERYQVGHEQLTMVRTNIPHNVHMGSSDRWCVSARAFDNTPGLWSDAERALHALILR